MNSERYSRQSMVQEFSGEGQQLLEDASVLVIGASSIGSTLMYNLASAGVGTIGVADHNIVGTSNLNAFVHFEEDLGTLKVISATRKLKAYNSLINVIPHATAINKDNVYEIVSQYDIVVLAVNNPQTQMLVNEACVELDKPFVLGKTNGFIGTAGFILPHETPCLACFYIILGVHILGPYASEMIWGAAALIENEMRVQDVKQMIFPHPTVCEAIREAIWSL